MKEKKDCNIVQDLLPNYIEKLTNKETNKYIEKHLANCKECTEILGKKEKELNVDKTSIKEIEYMRKRKKRLKILKSIISLFMVIILFIVGFNIGRKMYILMDLSIKGQKQYEEIEDIINDDKPDMKNEYVVYEITYDNRFYYRVEAYKKDGNYLAKIYRTPYNWDEYDIAYKNGDEEFYLDTKNKTLRNGSGIVQFNHQRRAYYGFWDSVGIALDINSIWAYSYIEDHQCYVIYHNGVTDFVEKDTGTIIQSYGSHRDEKYIYKTGIVEDSDITRPDTTGYKLLEI